MINKLEKGSKVGIVCCSNGKKESERNSIEQLKVALENIGLKPVFSNHIYAKNDAFSGTAKERAAALMNFYEDSSVEAIFDISGGDIANELLPELDFDIIAKSGKQFWGYSDLTTILNAIYTKTGRTSILWQVRNLTGDCAEQQTANFINTVLNGGSDLTKISYDFIQGDSMNGVVVGGNIRCFLKLAGTPYFPDLHGKILLLESYGGLLPRMATHLSQLKQMGAFEQISGVLLGTFSQLEQENGPDAITDLIRNYTGAKLPVAKTKDIGHGMDSKAIETGSFLKL